MQTDYEKMTTAELREALQKIADALEKKKAKASEALRPGDQLEVGADGGLRLVESEAGHKRLRESIVQGYMGMGLPREAAERAANRGEAA